MVRDVLRPLPRRLLSRLSPLDLGGFAQSLGWAEARPDCVQLAVAEFEHRGQRYVMPAPKGSNLWCIEFPLADEFYQQFTEGEQEGALLLLLATLAREPLADEAEALRRGDVRVPLYDRAEVQARAGRLEGVPYEVTMQALLYFAGLKTYVHEMYGAWLFDAPEGDDDEDAEPVADSSGLPDFGWWGVFQQVAEAGVFGHHVREVHQAPFHDVCVHLVRKRVEAEQQKRAMQSAHRSSRGAHNDE